MIHQLFVQIAHDNHWVEETLLSKLLECKGWEENRKSSTQYEDDRIDITYTVLAFSFVKCQEHYVDGMIGTKLYLREESMITH